MSLKTIIETKLENSFYTRLDAAAQQSYYIMVPTYVLKDFKLTEDQPSKRINIKPLVYNFNFSKKKINK